MFQTFIDSSCDIAMCGKESRRVNKSRGVKS